MTLKFTRIAFIFLLIFAMAAGFIYVLYDITVVDAESYVIQSAGSVATVETISSARGAILDRNGTLLASDRTVYSVTLSRSRLLEEDLDARNDIVLRLVRAALDNGVEYNDSFPVTMSAPFQYTALRTERQESRLQKFLERYHVDPDISAPELMSWMRDHYDISFTTSSEDARRIIGVRYELELRIVINTTDYVFASDVPVDFVTNIKEQRLSPVSVTAATKREYHTDYARHVLGSVGYISKEYLEAHPDVGYTLNSIVGKSGAESAVEEYLRGVDGQVHAGEGFVNYTVFSLWDTYRALHPLLGLLQPGRNTDMVRSMLAHQRQSANHILPVWSLMGNEGWCMTGYHGVSVVADAVVKGAALDREAVLAALRSTATWQRFPGMTHYMRSGYAPFDTDATAASNTLEYAYDDFAVSAAARTLGDHAMAQEFEHRAMNYRNVFDPRTGFATPRYSDGRFKADMDPLQTYGEGFIEGNSWNFSFHVPHDVDGLMQQMGGEQRFVQRLDSLFTMHLPERYYADNEDITADCLVGGYVHGNEPSHHVPYLYAWTTKPWLAQERLRVIMDKMYRNHIRGLGGNDDCGQMSAWYIFTTLGFYPVCPGTDQYVIGAPFVPHADVTLPNGRHLIVKAPKVSPRNRYVKRVLLNGKPYAPLYLTHRQLTEGCVLEFEMTDRPNRSRGLADNDKPHSLTRL